MNELTPSPAEHTEFTMRLSSAVLPARVLACRGVATYQKTLHEIRGNDSDLYTGGFDVVPTRRLARDTWSGALAGVQAEEAIENGVLFASGVHQTWPKGLRAGFADGASSGMWNAASLAVMPRAQASLADMSRMTNVLGPKTTWTVFPGLRDAKGELVDYSAYGEEYGVRIAAQLEPDAVLQMGAENDMGTYFASNKERGIEGVIIDTHHLLRASNQGNFRLDVVEALDEVFERNVPLVGVHVSVGREDSRHPDDRRRSSDELRVLMDAPQDFARTAAGRIITEACDIWHEQQIDLRLNPGEPQQQLHVTTEIPYLGVAKYCDQSDVSSQEFASVHAQAGRRIRDFIGRLF